MDRRRQEEEQHAMEAKRIQQAETERLRRQSLESMGPRLEVPPTVVPVPPVELSPIVDTRASGLIASQEQQVVDEYYDCGVQSPQALAITHTLGVDSQGSQEVAETYALASVCPTPATASPGVPAQCVIVKPSTTPMSLDTPVKTNPVVMSSNAENGNYDASCKESRTGPGRTSELSIDLKPDVHFEGDRAASR